MDLQGKRVVITGAGGGIGEGLALEFKKRGAASLVIGDIDGEHANRVASEVSGLAVTVDVSKEEEVKTLVEESIKVYGGIDLFCSNAGILIRRTSPSTRIIGDTPDDKCKSEALCCTLKANNSVISIYDSTTN